jgi:flavin reductase (DIM6/NTAB) family NADH-FMN oxidoreductase RutF
LLLKVFSFGISFFGTDSLKLYGSMIGPTHGRPQSRIARTPLDRLKAGPPSQAVKPPRLAEAHAGLECREYTTMEIGRHRIILGRVVAIYVEDRYVDPSGPHIKADGLQAISRMSGLGNYVRTRDAFMTIPRISFDEWKGGKR